MSQKTGIPIWRVMARFVANAPWRYLLSILIWTAIWTMPVLVGFIAAAFFDGLAGEQAGLDVPTLVAAVAAYIFARIGLVFAGMRNHSSLLFRTASSMRRSMLRWIYTLPGAEPVAETPGEVVSRFRDDVNHTVEAFDFTVDLIGSVVAAIVSVLILVTIDPFITLIVFTPIALVIIVVTRLGTTIRRYRRAARQSTEAITGFLGEMLASVQSVKVADAERPMLDHFDNLNAERKRMMVRDRTFTAGIEAVFHNTVSIGTGLILILAVDSLGSTGDGGLTIGQFSLFVYLLSAVTESAWFIGIFLARLRQAEVSVERQVALMEGSSWPDLAANIAMESDVEVDRLPDPAARNGAPLLSVRGLTYVYPTSGQGVRDIDLDIEPGAFVVLTGKIGSGKTTLLRTILGIVATDSGTIWWKGAKVEDAEAFMVPPRAAYTPQTPKLFSMSLRDNLLLGEDIDDDQLDRVVSMATMSRDVEAMNDGYETMVGPRGVRLSGGQIQRSAAARMLVRRPELLVFDDLSSALDVETEAELWDGLFDQGDATVLAVSHRRPALSRADLVVVMHDGRIVARGTSESLKGNPLFDELWGT